MLKMGFSLKPGWCSPDDPGSFLDFLAAIGVDAVELTLSSSGAFERKVAKVALARGLTITLHIAWDSEASWDWYRGWNIVHVPALYHQPRRTAVIKRGHAVNDSLLLSSSAPPQRRLERRSPCRGCPDTPWRSFPPPRPPGCRAPPEWCHRRSRRRNRKSTKTTTLAALCRRGGCFPPATTTGWARQSLSGVGCEMPHQTRQITPQCL